MASKIYSCGDHPMVKKEEEGTCPICSKMLFDRNDSKYEYLFKDYKNQEALNAKTAKEEELSSGFRSSAKRANAERITDWDLRDIVISTCVPSWPYKILDTVFAIESHEQGLLSHLVREHLNVDIGGANPTKAFDGVKKQLKLQCKALGGDAIIGCQFEHRVATAQAMAGLLGNKQSVEIFAYGTAVERIEKSDNGEI